MVPPSSSWDGPGSRPGDPVDPYPASPALADLPHRGGQDFRVTVDADGTRVVVRYVKDGVEVEEVWRVAAVETTY